MPFPDMLTGAVLSGGTSNRMGEEKGLVKLGGIPMVYYVAKTMELLADEVVVAVAPGMAERYRQVLGEERRIVEDKEAAEGPLAGLVTILREAKGDYVMVSPCDTPFVRLDVCQAIVMFAKGRDGAVPRVRGYLEPLHSAYKRRHCLAAFEEALDEGIRKASDAYKLLRMVHVEEEDLRALDPHLESFWNVNTSEDLEEAERRLRTHLF